MYNFEVSNWHTYFVSDAGVLVHNTCSMGSANGAAKASNEYRSASLREIKRQLDISMSQ
ncbi:hypothetical protein [Clostridium senegalense]|uniref:Intein C-terminal splicing domain-containing protein n=1 Tax=Clostridium senegalense TaxID=1465809 RepID=A0A6M0H4Z8_9CLOT|nr:hypothetical protein [Clostridium senegalense]